MLQSARARAGPEGYFLNVKSNSLAKGVYKLHQLLGLSPSVPCQGSSPSSQAALGDHITNLDPSGSAGGI